MMKDKGYWAVAIGLTTAALAASALLYPALPDSIPTHWNIRGEVDGWGSKTWATFLLPAMTAGFLVFFRFLPALSPKDFAVDPFRKTYLYIMVIVTALFTYMHGVMLFGVWQKVHSGKDVAMTRVMFAGMFLFLGLLGNVLGKIRRNFYIGMRLPWTLANDRVWNDTHRLAAWTTVGGSVLGFLVVVSGLPILIAFGLLIVALLIPAVYSFVHYKALERRGEL